MTVRPVLCAILLAAATGVAHADGAASGSDTAAPTKKIPEEEPVSPTGLIIAGVALAAFAVLLLVGRRKKPASDQPRGELAEVRLVIETDGRAMVWTQPSFKLPTDRLGEVVLHLPIGSHDVHIQIDNETFVRTIQVPAIRKMRLPINVAKERISRAGASGEMAAAAAPARNQAAQVPGFERSSSTTKPPTSMARAYPDSSTQGELGAKLAGLIDVELDTPKPEQASALPLDTGLDPGPGAIDFSPQRAPATKPPPLALDFSTPQAAAPGSLDLDDLEIPVMPNVPAAAPVLPPQPARVSPLAETSLPPPPARTSPLRDVVAPSNPQRSALGDAGPSRGRPPTSPLEGIRSHDRPKQPTLPPRAQNLDISLDDIAPVQAAPVPMRTKAPSAIDLVPPPMPRTVEPVRGPIGTPPRPSKAEVQKAASAVADFALDELPQRARAREALSITAPELDLAPPEHSAQRRQPSTDLDVGDFALDNFSQPVAREPVGELPKVTASSVMDLTLDDDDLPVQRIPAARTLPAKPTPDISDFELETTPPPLAPRPAADDRPPQRSTPAPAARPSTPMASSPAAVGAIANRYRKTGASAIAGPLGKLYRGRDENAGKDVWIEEVPRELTLTVPAATLIKLDHPNVLKFHEHVVEAAKGYVVTEVVEGKSLEQQLADRGGSLVLLEAIGIVDQVCAALAYAHDRGVFHRNVRPACVWISGRTVKLAGFGMSIGRPTAYQAPELAAGAAPGIRTDLYSVGVTLVQLLTGAVPSPGKIELPADVPRSLASLIRKLVSLEPMMRPTNIKAVRDAFSSVF